jgi:N-succinyldiaminopimelate aminotransferase
VPRHPDVAPSVLAIKGSVYSALAGRLERFAGETYPLHVGDTWMEPALGCRMEDLRVEEYPGLHRYTSVHGMPALVDAVVERVRERTAVSTERANVLITAGGTGGLGAVAGAILAPGDEVLLLAPHWPLIEGIVRSFHGTPVEVDFIGRADSPETALEIVARHLTPRTAAIYWNTPSNPTGRLIPRAWLEALAEWARRHDLWILADEVYEDYQFSGEHPYTRPLAPERTFACHSFSKAFGMAGNRCGYMVGPGEVMGELMKVSTHTFYSTPTASQVAALRALAGPGDEWARAARAQYAETARRAARVLGLEPPEGSTFLFFDLSPWLDDSGLLGLLEACAERGLLLAPGASFGPYPTHARLCYTATDPERALRGVDILAALLAARTRR